MNSAVEKLDDEIARIQVDLANVERAPPTIAERFAVVEAELRDAEALYLARGLNVGAAHPGETAHLHTPLRFRSFPGGARVLVPAGSRLGLDEQRSASTDSYSGLLEVAFHLPGT